MSRGKKAKRKIGVRRKTEAALRPTEAEGAAIPSGKSRPLNLSKTTNAVESPSKSLNGSVKATDEFADKKFDEKRDFCCPRKSVNGEIWTSSLTILFKSDELQTLRGILRKPDLSRTPVLLGAIILGKIDVVKRLLRDGHSINSRSEEDKTTALMWAVRNKDLEMINLLVRHGADLTLLDENDDNVALIAVQSSSWEQNDFLDFWSSIDCKIDIKHANTRGYTILHYARQRQWDVLENLIGKESDDSREKKSETVLSSSCFCCYCSSSSSARFRTKEVLRGEDLESSLDRLTVLFEEIVARYREMWSRDRELGYPGFRGGHGDSATTLEELMSLRREEIARLNTILPKLEDSYLQKLRDCWRSLIVRMRHIAAKNIRQFSKHVTLLEMQLFTHEISPPDTESFEFRPNQETNPPPVCDLPAGLGLN